MFNPPFIPKEFLQAQEKLMINQAPQTQKLVDQLIALNKVYTPDSFAVLTKTIDALHSFYGVNRIKLLM